MEQGVLSAQPEALTAICKECGITFEYPIHYDYTPQWCLLHRSMEDRPSDRYKDIRRNLQENGGKLVFEFPIDIWERKRKGEVF